MTADRRAALVERMLQHMKLCAYPCKPTANDCICRPETEIALDLALEEAAKVAEDYGSVHGHKIASAIRALKGKP